MQKLSINQYLKDNNGSHMSNINGPHEQDKTALQGNKADPNIPNKIGLHLQNKTNIRF